MFSRKNLADAEANLNHYWNIEDLQVKDLDADADVQIKTESDPICSSAGCTQYKQKKTGLGYPVDYDVPNFGRDGDINANMRSLAVAEKMYKHKLIMGTPESKAQWHNVAKDTEYDFEPKLDIDMRTTKKNLADTEKR